MKIDFAQIRQQNPLRAVVETTLGPPDYGDKWLCPFHDEKTASFGITPDGERFKCFGCEATGDVIDFVQMCEGCDIKEAADKLGAASFSLPSRKQSKKNGSAKKEKSVEEKIAGLLPKIQQYHAAVDPHRHLWHAEGIGDDVIDAKRLGYASADAYYAGPSLVLPYWDKDGGLLTVRHRLLNPNGKGKYRSEVSGLGNHLFNIPSLYNEPFFPAIPKTCAIIAEGEKKSLVLEAHGFPCVGIPGATSWRPEWVEHFLDAGIRWVFVALDPDTHPDRPVEREARRIVADVRAAGMNARLCPLTEKPDDLLTHTLRRLPHDQRVEVFIKWLKHGR